MNISGILTSALDPAAFYLAGVVFSATFLLGVFVQFGWVRTRAFRWVHHALFFVVVATAFSAVIVGVAQGRRYGFALIPALLIYLVLPRIRAGTTGHALLAFGALAFYAMGFVLIFL